MVYYFLNLIIVIFFIADEFSTVKEEITEIVAQNTSAIDDNILTVTIPEDKENKKINFQCLTECIFVILIGTSTILALLVGGFCSITYFCSYF